MSRCIIIGATPIGCYDKLKLYLNPSDYMIYCDGGLYHRQGLGYRPNLIIGDFDSHPFPDIDCEIITLPQRKDDTDTFAAAKEAIKRGFDEFILIGVCGLRLDHTLGNISLLSMLKSKEKKAMIIDDHSQMEIIDDTGEVSPDFSFFSLIPIDGSSQGVTIENALFDLKDATIDFDYAYAISNEPLPGKIARITIKKGRMLLIKIF